MRYKKGIAICSALVGLFFLFQWPTTTRQGINWEVSEIKIPLYFKTLQFISRHCEMKYYTRQILQNETDDLEKIKKLYHWMEVHIHPIPAGFDVIDDHPLHIFIRRYGAPDQMADLFSLMCTYAGFDAFFRGVDIEGKKHLLTFVKYKNSWLVFDVAHHGAFVQDVEPYRSALKNFNPEQKFSTRNLKQMPLKRFELWILH